MEFLTFLAPYIICDWREGYRGILVTKLFKEFLAYQIKI